MMTGSASWEPGYGSEPDDAGARFRLPAPATLAYAANALTVVFLLLALPYAAHRLMTRPGAAIRGAGRRQVG